MRWCADAFSLHALELCRLGSFSSGSGARAAELCRKTLNFSNVPQILFSGARSCRMMPFHLSQRYLVTAYCVMDTVDPAEISQTVINSPALPSADRIPSHGTCHLPPTNRQVGRRVLQLDLRSVDSSCSLSVCVTRESRHDVLRMRGV